VWRTVTVRTARKQSAFFNDGQSLTELTVKCAIKRTVEEADPSDTRSHPDPSDSSHDTSKQWYQNGWSWKVKIRKMVFHEHLIRECSFIRVCRVRSYLCPRFNRFLQHTSLRYGAPSLRLWIPCMLHVQSEAFTCYMYNQRRSHCLTLRESVMVGTIYK